MNSPTAPPRSAGVSGRALAALAALTTALVAAFVTTPSALSAHGHDGNFGDGQQLSDAFRSALVGYWRSGGPSLTPDLEEIVEYWQRYHVTKIVIGAVALVVLVTLGCLLWKAFLLRAGGSGQRIGLASAGTLIMTFSVVALLALMANVQGAVAPFASLMPLLIDGDAPDSQLAGTLEEMREQLIDAQNAGGRTSPAADVMIHEFGTRYHAAFAVIAAILALALVVLSVLAWRRFARKGTDRRAKRVFLAAGIGTALLALFMILEVVGNAGNAAAPLPDLLSLLEGSV